MRKGGLRAVFLFASGQKSDLFSARTECGVRYRLPKAIGVALLASEPVGLKADPHGRCAARISCGSGIGSPTLASEPVGLKADPQGSGAAR
jgi:hypothetical protein